MFSHYKLHLLQEQKEIHIISNNNHISNYIAQTFTLTHFSREFKQTIQVLSICGRKRTN